MSNVEPKTNSSLPEKYNPAAWGAPNMSAQDMIIPKILPLQFMSEKVKKEEGKYGEFRDTLSNKKLGDLQTPVEFVPILLQKKWIEFDLIPSKSGPPKREFKQVINIQDNPTKPGFNDNLPLKDEENKLERDRVMDFFCLLPSEIEKGDALPYVLSFRRTSLRAGKKLATQMYVRNSASNKIPAAVVCTLSGATKENDMGEFVVMDVNPKRESTEKEMGEAFKWLKVINQGAVKVDESEFKQEPQGNFEDLDKESKF